MKVLLTIQIPKGFVVTTVVSELPSSPVVEDRLQRDCNTWIILGIEYVQYFLDPSPHKRRVNLLLKQEIGTHSWPEIGDDLVYISQPKQKSSSKK